MKERIGFVALGQCGANICSLLEKKGYQVLFMNTSEEDLEVSAGKNRYKIKGVDGCNKDRMKSKQAVAGDFENIYNEIEKYITADFIYIVFGTGGGTGSGCSPLMADLLINSGKDVGLITVIPNNDESVKAQMNCYECFKELNDVEDLSSVFIIDNEKGNKFELNNVFVNTFDSFLNIPARHKSAKGNVDKAEIIETLRANGMAMVISGTEDLIDNVDKNIYAPREEDEVIKYITISLSNGVEIKDLVAKTGSPFDTFTTYNDKKNICCLSGLNYPSTRLDEVYELVNKYRDSIKKNLSKKKMDLDKEFDFFGTETKSKKVETKKKGLNKSDIFAKYMK